MKIRQALKMFNRSKSNLYDSDSISSIVCDDGFSMTSITQNRKEAAKRIVKYIKNNTKSIGLTNLEYKTIIEYYKKDLKNSFPDNLPKEDEELFCYDDGKIRKAREFTVKCLKIIPFNEAHEDIIKQWKHCLKEYPWVFSSKTDYFISCIVKEDSSTAYFARTVDDCWYSLPYPNLFNGVNALLDTTGEFHKSIE